MGLYGIKYDGLITPAIAFILVLFVNWSVLLQLCFQVSMHLWVFLFANHDRLKSRIIGDIRCSKSWVLHRLQTVMTFGDATHSKGDPQHYTLDFHKSPSVGENGESHQKAMLVKKNHHEPSVPDHS